MIIQVGWSMQRLSSGGRKDVQRPCIHPKALPSDLKSYTTALHDCTSEKIQSHAMRRLFLRVTHPRVLPLVASCGIEVEVGSSRRRLKRSVCPSFLECMSAAGYLPRMVGSLRMSVRYCSVIKTETAGLTLCISEGEFVL